MNFHVANLLLECDDSHSHLPWGLVQGSDASEVTFSTSLETEYPAGLSKQLALAFKERLQQQGKFQQLSNDALDQEERTQ